MLHFQEIGDFDESLISFYLFPRLLGQSVELFVSFLLRVDHMVTFAKCGREVVKCSVWIISDVTGKPFGRAIA